MHPEARRESADPRGASLRGELVTRALQSSPRGPPSTPGFGGSLATSCHLLAALSHCLGLGRKNGFFLRLPTQSSLSRPPPSFALCLSLWQAFWGPGAVSLLIQRKTPQRQEPKAEKNGARPIQHEPARFKIGPNCQALGSDEPHFRLGVLICELGRLILTPQDCCEDYIRNDL